MATLTRTFSCPMATHDTDNRPPASKIIIGAAKTYPVCDECSDCMARHERSKTALHRVEVGGVEVPVLLEVRVEVRPLSRAKVGDVIHLEPGMFPLHNPWLEVVTKISDGGYDRTRVEFGSDLIIENDDRYPAKIVANVNQGGGESDTIPCSSCGEDVYDSYPNLHVETGAIPCNESL